MRKRIVLLITAVLAVAGLTLPGMASAGTHPAAHHLTLAERVAYAHAHAPDASTFFQIETLNGIHACVGYIFHGPGNPVVEKLPPGCTDMTAHFIGNDFNGFAEYGVKFATIPESSYMAATNDCTKVTQKSSLIDNGVVWIWYDAPNGHLYFVPRFCNPSGSYGVQLAGQNNGDGAQWKVSANTALYRAIVLIPTG